MPKAVKPVQRMTHSERTERSDSRMFEVTIQSIVDVGTEQTKLKDVGERAGYSRGLAGFRFKSKEGLFCYAIKRIAEFWLNEMTQATQRKSGYDAICAVTDAHYQFCKISPTEVRAFYILWFESVGLKNNVQKIVVDIHKKRLNDIIYWIEKGINIGELSEDIDADAVAKQYMMTISGIIYQWLIDPEQDGEIKSLHDNLKTTMRLLLPVAGSKSMPPLLTTVER